MGMLFFNELVPGSSLWECHDLAWWRGLGACVVASERVSCIVFYVDLTLCIDSVIHLDYPTHVDALI